MDLKIYLISDGGAYLLKDIVHNTMSHFDAKYKIEVFDNLNNLTKLNGILGVIKRSKNSIIYHSFRDSKMNAYVKNFCKANEINSIELMDYSINSMAKILGEKPHEETNFIDPTEFLHSRRMDALDFAIKYDDGQDFRGLEHCDIAIIGVSRSSKTPLSMYMASKGYKVSNIPLLIDSKVPQALFEIDPSKIFGLTIDKDVLKKIREERLKSLNLSVDSLYSSKERIKNEIDYALELMNDLGCTIIDVTYRSIEETSELIIDYLNQNKEREKLWAQNTFITSMKATNQWEAF